MIHACLPGYTTKSSSLSYFHRIHVIIISWSIERASWFAFEIDIVVSFEEDLHGFPEKPIFS